MKTGLIITVMLSLLLSSVACDKDDSTPDIIKQNRVLNITNKLISSEFVGNGAQWGGYDLVPTWLGTETLSEADWNKLFQRIDFMRPPFLRIMTSSGWAYMNDGQYNESAKTTSLFKMLDYAQSRNIEITYGEWGHSYTGNRIDVGTEWIANSVRFLNHLINEKGYTCIKTVNIINEPNGNWSTANGDYNVYKKVQELYLAEMAKYALANVKLMGPDIAIFNAANQVEWLTKTTADLGDNMGLYDVHVYPKQQLVRNGEFGEMLQVYRKVTPADKRIVLGEIGFKYTEVDAELQKENKEAIANDPYAGDDSNMMVYKAFYGIDMADALIQAMREGYSGALIWDMDDAMYNSPDDGNYQTEKLKRWGFWNILGEELCGDASDEEIRPFFYPVSLLCRYFPAGSDIYNIELPDKKGVRAVWAEKDGKYTIALVNSHVTDYELVLKSESISNLTANKYSYKSNTDGSFIGAQDENGFATPSEKNIDLDFENGVDITLEGQSFILYTNMN
ncbi:hypothetical protein [Mariniphaga anaerophila]|nr:hypothetical protein [Mariniphaga anaerophila]